MKKHEDPKAWKSYFEDPKLELKANPENVTIKVIGVFDTVGSVGIPENKLIEWIGWNNKYKFHDTELSDRTSLPSLCRFYITFYDYSNSDFLVL